MSSKFIQSIFWLVSIILAAMAIAVNLVFINYPLLYRVLAIIVLIAGGISVFLLTHQGKKAIELFKGARFEIKKVIWPSRAEVFQTALLVLVFVFISSILIWGFDTVILILIRSILGS